jgi:lipopolysaccharide/colanic/teichoic acid biosynthesis glycosyltransferase/nucleoside-diphosphate-sugar epimerase
MIEGNNELKGKCVLVTGAAGFVGSRLVKRLLDGNAEVFALVDESSSTERINSLINHKNLHLVRCSLNDASTLSAHRSKWGNIDYVVHLWLKMPTGSNFPEQSIEDINLNLLPTMNLLRTLGKSIKGICFASSISVYGCPAHLPIMESDVPAPITSYAATKLAIENYLRSYGIANKVPVTILRYSTIYGPGELNHRAIPNFIHSIADGNPPVITGDGSEVRDYIYIDDVILATVRAITAGTSQVLNIGSGQGHSTLEIAREIMKLYPLEIKPRFTPSNKQNINLVCDISAAQKALSYSPQTSLEEGLKQEIDWFKKHMQPSISKENNKQATAGKKQGRFQKVFNYSLFKNIFDCIFAFFVLTVSSPLLVLIMIGIKLDSHGKAIYSQERVGENGRKFTVYKFRTMQTNNNDSKYKEYLRKYVLDNAPYRVDQNGHGIYKVDDDCHTTKFGAVLRKTNLDELPQFINILKGDMSLIGPRPDVPFAVDMYKDWHRARLQAKPGITGLWQVCGRKGLSFDEMTNLDIEYIKKRSLLLDAKIFTLTVRTILKMDGS